MTDRPRLSPREIECMQAAVDRLSTKETSRLLQLSPDTIRKYRWTAREKLGATNEAEAVRTFIRFYPPDRSTTIPGDDDLLYSASTPPSIEPDGRMLQDAAVDREHRLQVTFQPRLLDEIKEAVAAARSDGFSWPVTLVLTAGTAVVFGLLALVVSFVASLLAQAAAGFGVPLR